MIEMKRFRAKIYFEDFNDKPHIKVVRISEPTAKKAYNRLKQINGLIDILEFEEIR